MNTTVKNKIKTSPLTNGNSELYYPSEERKKMGETDYQHLQISILEQTLRLFLMNRNDVYVASDLFVYYEKGNLNRRFAPDLMACFGAENKMRRTYKLWEEKIVPQIIIEVVSKETWQKDVTTKRRLFEKLGVAEYYVIDPEYKYLPQPMFAYRLEFGELVRLSIQNDRIFSELLNLEIVNTGNGFRFFDVEKDEFISTLNEIAITRVEVEKENNFLKAEIERLKKLVK